MTLDEIIARGGPDLAVALRALGIDPWNPADAADRDAVTVIAVRRSAAFADAHTEADRPRLRLVE